MGNNLMVNYNKSCKKFKVKALQFSLLFLFFSFFFADNLFSIQTMAMETKLYMCNFNCLLFLFTLVLKRSWNIVIVFFVIVSSDFLFCKTFDIYIYMYLITKLTFFNLFVHPNMLRVRMVLVFSSSKSRLVTAKDTALQLTHYYFFLNLPCLIFLKDDQPFLCY